MKNTFNIIMRKKLEQDVTQPQDIPINKNRPCFHRLIMDECAVGAAQIFNRDNVTTQNYFYMLPRHTVIVNHDAVDRRASNRDLRHIQQIASPQGIATILNQTRTTERSRAAHLQF